MKKKTVIAEIPQRLKKAIIKYPTYGECFRALKSVKGVIELAKAVMKFKSPSVKIGDSVNMQELYSKLRKILIEEEERNYDQI